MNKYLFTGLLFIAGALHAEEQKAAPDAGDYRKDVAAVAAFFVEEYAGLQQNFTEEQKAALKKYAINDGKEVKNPLKLLLQKKNTPATADAMKKDSNYLAVEKFLFKTIKERPDNTEILAEQLDIYENPFVVYFFKEKISNASAKSEELTAAAGAINALVASITPAAETPTK